MAADVYVVVAEVYREPVIGELVAAGVTEYEIPLPGELPGWLVVEAPGYELWVVQLRYRVETSRTLSGPVDLVRVRARV